MAEQWYSIVEYARAFAISDMTVRRRIKNGKLKAVLKDGKYFIPVGPDHVPPTPELPTAVSQRPLVRPQQSYPEELDITTPAPPTRPLAHRPQPVASAYVPPTAAPSYVPPRQPAPAVHMPIPPGTNSVPETIRRQIMANESTTVSSQALISFCDKVVKVAADAESRVRQSFQGRISALEAALKAKDAEISNLCRQIEDLQVLVQVFEKGR